TAMTLAAAQVLDKRASLAEEFKLGLLAAAAVGERGVKEVIFGSDEGSTRRLLNVGLPRQQRANRFRSRFIAAVAIIRHARYQAGVRSREAGQRVLGQIMQNGKLQNPVRSDWTRAAFHHLLG